MKNEVGVMVGLTEKPNFDHLAKLNVRVCQVVSGNHEIWTDALAMATRDAARRAGVRITAFWSGWPGPSVWDFLDGPATIGIVPAKYRAMRVAALKKGGDFASKLGVPATITHLGFVPEDPKDPLFQEVVDAVRDIALHLQKLGLEFWFETGQETPTALLRLIHEVKTPNLGINLDTANLILYGKANPIDALDTFGSYVKNVHAKDGMYPTDPMKLGVEVKVGQGRVRFPDFIKRMAEIGYQGEYIIEREISGEQQRRDIEETVHYLRRLLGQE